MKTIILTATLTALSAMTSAQDKTPPKEAPPAESAAPMSGDWKSGTVSFGAQQTDSNSISSKFMEYRDVPNGVIAPYFRFQGKKNDLSYDFVGENVKQTDQRFRMRIGEDRWKVEGDYNRIPHNFGNGGHTLLQETSPGVWEMSDTLQQSFQTTLESTTPRSRINYPFLLNLVSPSLAAGNQVDIKLTRERGNLTFITKPSDPVEFRVTYARERRTGSRAASGTSFGFGNVVEQPEPLHYLSQDFGAEGQYEAAEHYTLYREQRRKLREEKPIPPEVAERIRDDAKYFPTPLQAYQFYSKFSRWREQDGRRETWPECNGRVFDWFATLPAYFKLDDGDVPTPGTERLTA